ncbi:MAG TPA: dockerin type I domain-containing protein [Planctomycetota bacterium]|nr:dockerin type I domain-containing protein [Planctomycetota bacterium]
MAGGRARFLIAVICAAFALSSGRATAAETSGARFLRGDPNRDRQVSLADVLAILRYLHLGESLACLDAADVDDSGTIDSADFGYLLGSIFWRHTPPPPPYPSVGVDPTPDDLSCETPLFLEKDGKAREAFDDGAIRGAAPDGQGLDTCFPDNGGVDTEFILFRYDRVFVVPGQTGVRVPILMSALAGVEAITLSVRADPPLFELEDIDFGPMLERTSPSLRPFVHTYRGLQASGYLASMVILDVNTGSVRLGEFFYNRLALLEFSVRADAPIGSLVDIAFEDIRSPDDLPPIRNELVRSGRSLRSTFCGLTVEVVSPEELFVRGDANRDGQVDLSDAVSILSHIIDLSSNALPCPDAADVNDDGEVHVDDALRLLRFLFQSGSPPHPPFELAGVDYWRPDSLPCAAPRVR